MKRIQYRRGIVASALAAMVLCASVLTPARAYAQQIRMLTPEERIQLSHQTRLTRLKRIVSELGIVPAPSFYEYVVPASKMPGDFPYDTPVLRIVFHEKTFFDTGSTELLPQARRIALAMALMLQGDVQDVSVFVAGHTDNRGGEEYNQDLSVGRARAVAEALRDAGASNPRLWSIGFGEGLPVAENSGEHNLSMNRRVEFLLSARVESVANWMKDQMSLICSEGTLDERGRCVRSVRQRDSYTAEPVARRSVQSEAPKARTALRSAPKREAKLSAPARVAVRPPDQRIEISLKERTFKVGSMEH